MFYELMFQLCLLWRYSVVLYIDLISVKMCIDVNNAKNSIKPYDNEACT